MSNAPCIYCGELNHRQGSICDLWCKHTNERGIPIVRFNDNQRQPVQNTHQQNRPPQANVVLVEEQDTSSGSDKQEQNVKDLRVLHVQCDCSQCKQKEVVLEKPVTVLAVTRSRKHHQQDKDIEDRVIKDPKVWEEQKKVRMGCLREIQK